MSFISLAAFMALAGSPIGTGQPSCCATTKAVQVVPAKSYICPITGETLPCEGCCPAGKSDKK